MRFGGPGPRIRACDSHGRPAPARVVHSTPDTPLVDSMRLPQRKIVVLREASMRALSRSLEGQAAILIRALAVLAMAMAVMLTLID